MNPLFAELTGLETGGIIGSLLFSGATSIIMLIALVRRKTAEISPQPLAVQLDRQRLRGLQSNGLVVEMPLDASKPVRTASSSGSEELEQAVFSPDGGEFYARLRGRGQHEEGEHQREHEVEQVVAGVESREADAEGDREEAPAGAGRAQDARRREPAPQAAAQSGTGTRSRISLRIHRDSSGPWRCPPRRRSATRCARTSTVSSAMSSGMQ